MPSSVCIVGGGPAGIMLGLLLARAGVPVTVLEKHKDFFRDFRGDTIHPSTLELLYELGLLDKFLLLPHSQIARLSAVVGGQPFVLPDFTHLPVHARFIALMPQWDFLAFLADEAKKYPTFTLRMGWEATDLLQQSGPHGPVVTGVRAQTPDGPVDIPATLTVGCDGRRATSRAAAHLPVKETGVPIDILWFRLSRHPGDPENALGYINFGRFLILINRDSYFQCGYLIPKGSFDTLKARGLPAFQQGLEHLAPFLAGRTVELAHPSPSSHGEPHPNQQPDPQPDPHAREHPDEHADPSGHHPSPTAPTDPAFNAWDNLKLLTIQVNHLQRWSLPGLLCIGDAAHAMSPVGGIGINIALQDAVATANRLAAPLLTDALTIHDLAAVQHYRQRAVRNTQRVQVFAHRILNRVLHNPAPAKPPLLLRLLSALPWVRRRIGHFIGMGLQPQHIQTPERHA